MWALRFTTKSTSSHRASTMRQVTGDGEEQARSRQPRDSEASGGGRHIHMAESLKSGTGTRGFWASPLDAAQAAAFDVSQMEYLVLSLKTCSSLPSSTVPMSN